MCLDHDALNGILQLVHLRLQVGRVVGGDRGCNHGARHAAGTAQGDLAADEHVRDVL